MVKKFWANLALCAILGGFLSFALTNISSALTARGLFVRESKPSAEVAALLPDMYLLKYHLVEKRGRMVHADFIVQNNSDQDVKNFRVRCEFFGPHGKYLDRKIWLLGNKVQAGETLQYNLMSKRFVHTRASTYQCELVDFSLDSPPFFVLHRGGEGNGNHHGFVSDHGKGDISVHVKDTGR